MESNDGHEIPRAFRSASEGDVLRTMDEASKSGSLKDFYYYMVPTEWMNKAWPFLMRNEPGSREEIGPVNCNILLNESKQLKTENDDNTSRTRAVGEKKRSWNDVKPEMQHIVHFFYLGPNAWTLVSSKFGYDVEIYCQVNRSGSSLQIRAPKWKSVEIPPEGRLKYQEHFSSSSSQQNGTVHFKTNGSNGWQPQPQEDHSAAFRKAYDQDVNEASDLELSTGSTEKFVYYMVTGEWMRSYWRLFRHHHLGSEEVGPIRNNPLLSPLERFGQETTKSNEYIEDRHRTVDQCEQLWSHGRDFYLVGRHVWALFQSKYGYDVEITCPLIRRGDTLKVRTTSGWNTVVVPKTGKFDFNQQNFSDITSIATSVSDDDEDEELEGANSASVGKGIFGDADMSDDGAVVLRASDTPPLDSQPASSQLYNNYWDEATGDPEPVAPKLKPHGSGLSNLGNTCFMNSSLQCLAHTDPLRRYFLTGEYDKDLNRDNPLGTGGDLAVEFAKLLEEMWLESPSQQTTYSFYGGAVSPRSFKTTLGRHASQFMGYDQHDSQEVATYLLDALHEDTNRISKKPYTEKPEKGANESDEDAARKAWVLHLKRDDSKILEDFMGQIKSRVECCRETCSRVSTTFDPFMYLSVPLPGTSDKAIDVTFVPLSPEIIPRQLTLQLPKSTTIATLKVKVIQELANHGIEIGKVDPEDIAVVELFNNEVFAWHEDVLEIDSIAPNDQTFLYQLRSADEVRREGEETARKLKNKTVAVELPAREPHFQLDIASAHRLRGGDTWSEEMHKYLQQPLGLVNAFHPTKGSTESRMKYYTQTIKFVEDCHKEIAGDSAGSKRAREPVDTEKVIEIVEKCASSEVFKDVSSKHDLAVLETVASQMRDEINERQRSQDNINVDGVVLEVRQVAPKSATTAMSFSTRYSDRCSLPPLVLRLPGNMTVYEFRCELGSRLRRSLKLPEEVSEVDGGDEGDGDQVMGDDSMVFRRLPLKCSSGKTGLPSKRRLGSIKDTYDLQVARRDDDNENDYVANSVAKKGTISVEWTSETFERFDPSEYSAVEKTEDPMATSNGEKAQTVTVLDCIEKYCQKEQLEETEMWYCNQCKEHVRAWKQFSLYRCPPILIVHLKRFQFSARTHRRDKIGLYVDFPLTGLDLTGLANHWVEEEKPIYDCYAVSNHYGGLGAGHYTAYCLNSDGTWCYYDDSSITKDIDPKDVVSEAAYVLYYRRHDVEVGDDFPLPIQTKEPETSTAIVVHDNGMDGVEDISDNMSTEAVDDAEAKSLGSVQAEDEEATEFLRQ